jgi:hypothetical protein
MSYKYSASPDDPEIGFGIHKVESAHFARRVPIRRAARSMPAVANLLAGKLWDCQPVSPLAIGPSVEERAIPNLSSGRQRG